MFALIIGCIGNVTAVIGYLCFHSLWLLLAGTGVYFLEKCIRMITRKKILTRKKISFIDDIIMFVIGSAVGLLIKSVPWYVCGMLAINFWMVLLLVFGIILKIFENKYWAIKLRLHFMGR